MSLNLFEKTAEKLGFGHIRNVDPTTGDIRTNKKYTGPDRLAPAVVPAVLAGIYKLSKSDEGVNIIYNASQSDWGTTLFGNNKELVISRLAEYSNEDRETINIRIDEVSRTAVDLIKENNTRISPGMPEIKEFISHQRNNILSHLPAFLHIGDLLNDDTLDDHTNRMQGPVSSLMHKIEEGFGGHETFGDAARKTRDV